MNVRCPSCQTLFRVDPERVPAAGVNARCSRCPAVFRLERDGAGGSVEAAAGVGAGASTPHAPQARVAEAPAATAPPPPPPARPAPVPPPRPAAPAPAPRPAAQAPAPAPGSVAQPAPAPSPAPAKRPSFRNQDPQARAQRIARALVSDIVAYNKGKLKDTMDAARLRTEFREEIRKSWEEYVEQVGLDLAKSTPYFRDSLNEILAKGQKVF